VFPLDDVIVGCGAEKASKHGELALCAVVEGVVCNEVRLPMFRFRRRG
jgi:hypothetical protein